jgi:glycine cleavage system aminomethyltransferase T
MDMSLQDKHKFTGSRIRLITDLNKPDFIGREALVTKKVVVSVRKVLGFELLEFSHST